MHTPRRLMEAVNRRTGRIPARCVVVIALLGAVGYAAPSLYGGPGGERASQTARVEMILATTFLRVPGTAYGGAALDTGPAGSWYSDYVGSPTVDFDGELYRMWFVGGSKTTDAGVPYGAYERIGLATSRDGIHWELANDARPVLDLGPPGSADQKGLSHPFVLRDGDRFLMWYGGVDGTQAKDLGLAPAHVRVERICLATSRDGVHWERANGGRPVLDIGPEGSIDSIQATGMHVLKIDGELVMWYGAYNGRHTFGMATSSDGIHWTKGNGGKSLTGLVEKGQGQAGMSVHYDGRQYLMLYGSDFEGQWVLYGATSSDGVEWQPAYSGHYLLGPAPAGNFATAGRGRNHACHPSQFILADGQVRIWYCGEDGSPPHHSRIGLMEAGRR